MAHFEIGVWLSYARRLLPRAERRKLDQHLRQGCPECLHELEFVQRMLAAAAGVAVEVPVGVEKSARAIAAPLAPKSRKRSAKAHGAGAARP